MEPFRLCNPVDKNGEGIDDPDTHLVCYIVQPEGDQLGLAIPIQNQFFPLANVDLAEPFALCTPSTKQRPEPTVLAEQLFETREGPLENLVGNFWSLAAAVVIR